VVCATNSSFSDDILEKIECSECDLQKLQKLQGFSLFNFPPAKRQGRPSELFPKATRNLPFFRLKFFEFAGSNPNSTTISLYFVFLRDS
jgi:hypothetical protein